MTDRPTLIEFVDHYTREYSSHVFLREKVGEKWTETTFEETRIYGCRIGAGLMAMGLAKGDKVALLSEGRNMWVLAELGILYAGGVSVPLSIKLEESNDLTFRINHSESRFVIVSAQQLPKIRKVLPQCPGVEKVIVMDNIQKMEPREITMEWVDALGASYLFGHRAEFEERGRSVGPDDYATISYTSGTTADPKGVLLTHRNYTANVEQAHSVIGIEPDAVMLIILPLDHCFAHVAGFYTMMSYCGSIATVPVGKNPLATLKNIPVAIREVRPHVMLSVPALARNFRKNIEAGIRKQGPKAVKLYERALRMAISYNKEYYNAGGLFQWWKKPFLRVFDKVLFSKVRESFGGRMKFFVGGGALLDIELQKYFNAIGIPMFQGYGVSEATPIISSNSTGHAIFGSSGRVVSGLDIKICGEDGKEVPAGTKGEIVVRGENIMAGYWKNPEGTAEALRDGWLHTGDMGYMLDKEYLYVVGRFKSLLISSDGEKYSPEGFEDSLTDGSKYVEQVILHNNQDPYTMVLIVPAKDALREYAKAKGLDPASVEGRRAMLSKIQDEVDSYRKGGIHEGMFPERWLPAAIAVLPEPFTEQNGLVNSTMKIVRGKVEKHYASRIEYAYTPEGKDLFNSRNLESLL